MPNGFPDGNPEPTWRQKELVLWLVHEVRALRKGHDNHLTSHFRTNLVLLGGVFVFIAALIVLVV